MSDKSHINGHGDDRINRHTFGNEITSENLSFGYVKLYRSIIKKGWYHKSEFVHLFCHLLLKASHSGAEFWFNGTIKTLLPGQFITGRKKLSTETGIDQHKIDRILKVFETEQQIEQQTTSTSRLITIVNWDKYQNSEQPFEQQLSNDCATTEQRVSTFKNVLRMVKNVKNDKKYTPANKIFKVPELNEVISFFKERGSTEEQAKKAFDYYSLNNWKDKNNKQVKSWRQKMLSVWINNKNQINGEHKQHNQVSNMSEAERGGQGF